MNPQSKDHLWQQFDKLYVGALLLLAVWLLTHNLKYYGGNDSVINQTWGMVTFFLGLLSGLITGQANKNRAADKNGNGDTNGTKTTDTTTTVASTIVSRSELPKTGESTS